MESEGLSESTLKNEISSHGYQVRISHKNDPDVEAIGTNTEGNILLGMGITELDALEDLLHEITRYHEIEEAESQDQEE